MIKNVIFSFLFIDLMIATAISIYWFTSNPRIEPHVVHLGADFMAFVMNVSEEMEGFTLEIPTIPKLDIESIVSEWWFQSIAVVNTFYYIVLQMANLLILVLNVAITALNYLFKFLEFALIFLYQLDSFVDQLESQPVPSVDTENPISLLLGWGVSYLGVYM